MDGSWVIWALLAIVVVIFVNLRFSSIKGMRDVGADTFRAELDDGTDKMLIDVREPHEFKSGHIRGARNIPLSGLSERTAELPRDRKLLIYCQSGMRSRQAGRILSKQGFEQLVNLRGGIMAWRGKIE